MAHFGPDYRENPEERARRQDAQTKHVADEAKREINKLMPRAIHLLHHQWDSLQHRLAWVILDGEKRPCIVIRRDRDWWTIALLDDKTIVRFDDEGGPDNSFDHPAERPERWDPQGDYIPHGLVEGLRAFVDGPSGSPAARHLVRRDNREYWV